MFVRAYGFTTTQHAEGPWIVVVPPDRTVEFDEAVAVFEQAQSGGQRAGRSISTVTDQGEVTADRIGRAGAGTAQQVESRPSLGRRLAAARDGCRIVDNPDICE